MDAIPILYKRSFFNPVEHSSYDCQIAHLWHQEHRVYQKSRVPSPQRLLREDTPATMIQWSTFTQVVQQVCLKLLQSDTQGSCLQCTPCLRVLYSTSRRSSTPHFQCTTPRRV